MTLVAFVVVPEPGHVNPTFRLARELAARGHRIVYICPPVMEARNARIPEYIEAQGFSCFRLPGAGAEGSAPGVAVGWLQRRRASQQRVRGMARFIEEELPKLLERLAPGLLLVDVLLSYVALSARPLGIPAGLYNTGLPYQRVPGLPPSFSPIVPDGSWSSRVRGTLAWQRYLWARSLDRQVSRFLGGDRLDVGSYQVLGMYQRLAARAEVPLERICFETMGAPVYQTTELLLFPEAFDFPGARLEHQHYTGPLLDLERKEAPFAWERLDAKKPLLYCSMGSQVARTPQVRRLFTALLEVLHRRQDLQAVITLGEGGSPAGLGEVPPNALLVEVAPQLALLQRASLAISHGGLNSIKECIWFGVPLLVFPLLFEQPGSAARVVAHGLGLMGALRGLSSPRLERMIDSVLGEPSFRARTQAMRERFMEADQPGRAMEILEGLMRDRQSQPAGLEASSRPTLGSNT